jgi:hypothetical protein
LVATNGFDVAARILVTSQSLDAALAESLRSSIAQPVGTIMLAAPFLGVEVLAVELATRTTPARGGLFFVAIVAVLCWLYFSGFWSAQHALLERKSTAAALSVGMLPFLSVFVLLVAAIIVGILLWTHERTET